MKSNVTDLNEIMEFGHVIEVHEDGTTTEPSMLVVPETIYQTIDSDGQCIDNEVHGLPEGWSLMNGYSRQQSYGGPVMHTSEYIGGRMERDIRATPGFYVSVLVDGMYAEDGHDDDSEDLAIGWAVAFKQA